MGTYQISKNLEVHRAVFGKLSNLDNDLTFGPNPKAAIQFEDPAAKYACVEKFDTNGDGEVSYEEAAAAISLEGLFVNWNTVTSFEEIKFFTGITSTVGVFSGLSQLERITIPSFISTLGSFKNCTSLKTVVLPDTISSLPNNCFENCTAIESINLPKDIQAIPDYCFRGCCSLTCQLLPASLTAIGQYAFEDCSSLESILLPDSLISIGNYAFHNCFSFQDMELPSKIESIGSLAFSHCSNMKLDKLPESLKSLGQFAFEYCESITVDSLPNGLTIGTAAFSHCYSISSMTINGSFTNGKAAFQDCTSLTSVILPDYLQEIPESFFASCIALKNISWPSALKKIGAYSFSGCQFMNNNFSLEIPGTVTNIGEKAFGYVYHLIIPSQSFVSIESNSFIKGCTYLYVPANLVEMYKAHSRWSYYANRIRPIDNYPVSDFMVGDIGDAVDLGLSVKWASWNLGASAPEDGGDYYAWAETEPYYQYGHPRSTNFAVWKTGKEAGYDSASYSWYDSSTSSLTKYNTVIYNTDQYKHHYFHLEDDAANVNWGDNWRIPSYYEWQELSSKCKWTWTSKNGVYGYTITSNEDGYTDKTIFLPAAGGRGGISVYNYNTNGKYWTSSLFYSTNKYDLLYALNVSFGKELRYISTNTREFRWNGYSIRPVCPKD